MISTHILDTSKGFPASQVTVTLELQSGNEWNVLGSGKTNEDGRYVFDCENKSGVYRLVFEVEDYFAGQEAFYSVIPVIFKISNTQRKYHVPLLLNPFGYSTYRGS